MSKLPEGYQAYEVLLTKFKEEFGDKGLIDVSETQIMAVGEDTYITKHVAKVYVDGQLRASAVINSIDADTDDSAKAESKAVRRALSRLPGFDAVSMDAVNEEEEEDETPAKKTSSRPSGLGKTTTSSSKPTGLGGKAKSKKDEEEEEEEDDVTEEDSEEEEEVAYTKPAKMSSEEILNKYRKKA